MRVLGFIATAIGIVMLLVSCNMDVSVETGLGSRVNNIGLMQQQSMLANVSLGLMLIGVVMWVAGRRKPTGAGEAKASLAYSADEMRDLDVLLADKGWTGITLRADDPKVVHSVSPGSTADLVGVRPGDRLIQIDGAFTGSDLRSNVMQLAGDAGTIAVLKIRRGDHALEVDVEREHGHEQGAGRAAAEPRSSESAVTVTPSPARQEGYGVWPYIAIFAIGLILLYVRLK